MSAGRPPDGWDHVDRLEGAEEEKRRLKIVLETVAGERTIEQTCEELGISPSRYHELRHRVLQAALDGMAPGVPGRPQHEEPAIDPEHVKAVERENQELKRELQAAYTRTEIALSMPHVLTPAGKAEIKKKARRGNARRRRGSGGAGSGT